MHKVGIVGAGIGGLAASIRLALAGFEVSVFEALPGPGGKLDQFELQGFRFDKGPSLFTLPDLVEELFHLAGRPMADYFEYQRIDEACRYFWDDGTRLTAHADIDRFDDEVRRILGEKKGAVSGYLAQSARLYNQTKPLFLERSLHRWTTYVQSAVWSAFGALGSLGWNRSLHAHNTGVFRNPKTVQLFDRFATYNGSDPYQTPSIMQLIPHLEHGLGTYLPKGGLRAVPLALHRLAEELGVKFHFSTPVARILHENSAVVGLELSDGTVQKFDRILSNADVFTTYAHLLSDLEAPAQIRRAERSSSAVLFYWGIDRGFPELGLHNIFFSGNYRSEFEHIFRHKTLSDDPTIYVNITSKFEPSDAPQGQENWFVMVNSPAAFGQDWDATVPLLRANVIERLSAALGLDIGMNIVCEETLQPDQIEQWTRSHRGALYGTSSNSLWSAFLRHPNRSAEVTGLYFCGGSVHPGGGIPLCLQSARIASQWIIDDAGR